MIAVKDPINQRGKNMELFLTKWIQEMKEIYNLKKEIRPIEAYVSY